MTGNFDVNIITRIYNQARALEKARDALGWGSIHAIYFESSLKNSHIDSPCGVAPSEMQALHWIGKVQRNSGATYYSITITSDGMFMTAYPPDQMLEQPV